MTKKFLSLLLALSMLLTVVGASAEDVVYERGDDDEIYEEVLGDFEALMEAAEAAESIDERFILEAKAEAYLLEIGLSAEEIARIRAALGE